MWNCCRQLYAWLCERHVTSTTPGRLTHRGVLMPLRSQHLSIVLWPAAWLTLSWWALILVVLSRWLPTWRIARLRRLACRSLLWVVGVRLTVIGAAHVPRKGAGILVGNHVNLLDPLLLGSVIARPVAVFERADHFSWPCYGGPITALGHIPVELDSSPRRRVRAVLAGRDALRKGNLVAVMPEGTRTRDGTVGSFALGAFQLAVRTQAPIVPFAICGAFQVLRTGSRRIAPGPVTLEFLPPISVEPSASTGRTVQAETLRDQVRAVIVKAMEDVAPMKAVVLDASGGSMLLLKTTPAVIFL